VAWLRAEADIAFARGDGRYWILGDTLMAEADAIEHGDHAQTDKQEGGK
jgi:hypothetical protein